MIARKENYRVGIPQIDEQPRCRAFQQDRNK